MKKLSDKQIEENICEELVQNFQDALIDQFIAKVIDKTIDAVFEHHMDNLLDDFFAELETNELFLDFAVHVAAIRAQNETKRQN